MSSNRVTTRSRRRRAEEGQLAIILAMAVVLLLSATVGLVFQLAQSGTTFSAFTRQQSQALNAAEGGLDLTLGDIQQGTPLPCNPESYSFGTAPVPSSVTVTITYFSVYPPNPPAGELGCTQGEGPSASPASAVLFATGTSGVSAPATQYMEDVLLFDSETQGSVFKDAIFSYQGISLQQSMRVDSPAHIANVYVAYSGTGTNSGMTCDNSTDVEGNVTVQGPFTAQSSCQVQGSVYAQNIYAQDSTVIEGEASVNDSPCSGSNLDNVLENGTSVGQPPGTITLENSASIAGAAYACGSITKNSGTVGSSHITSTPPTSPDGTETFPSVPENSTTLAQWAAAGYTVTTDNTCSDFINGLPHYSGNTIFVTNCPVQMFQSTQIELTANVAIMSTGGFWSQNSSSWRSSNATTRDLYLIVPSSVNGTSTTCSAVPTGNYSATSPPPSNTDITLRNSTSFANTLNVLYYTPCVVQIGASAVGYGQVYGGQVTVTNSSTLTYDPPPPPPGATGGGSTAITAVSLKSERQLSRPPTL